MKKIIHYFVLSIKLLIHISICSFFLWPLQLLQNFGDEGTIAGWAWKLSIGIIGLTAFGFSFIKLTPMLWDAEELGLSTRTPEEELAELGLEKPHISNASE
jgi:hypothetical protein